MNEEKAKRILEENPHLERFMDNIFTPEERKQLISSAYFRGLRAGILLGGLLGIIITMLWI